MCVGLFYYYSLIILYACNANLRDDNKIQELESTFEHPWKGSNLLSVAIVVVSGYDYDYILNRKPNVDVPRCTITVLMFPTWNRTQFLVFLIAL